MPCRCATLTEAEERVAGKASPGES